jgi:mono/diheme cytochrome c family protein
MLRPSAVLSALAALALVLGAGACEDRPVRPLDGGSTSVDPAVIARGEYLVNNVSACVECHTPLNPDGTIDRGRLLGGNADFLDLVPDDPDRGLLPAPNLTPHGTGLASWSDAEIRAAFQDGHARDGRTLSPIMPYDVFHNMSDDDAQAIVAYLRTVEPVDQAIGEPQALPAPFDHLAAPLDPDVIPESTLSPDDPGFDAAQRGRYLAAFVGLCVECHTPLDPDGEPFLFDMSRAFSGGVAFPAAAFRIPSPPYPAVIFSRNITPDPSGIDGATPRQICDALRLGIDPEGERICTPMPVGPDHAYGGLTEEDALAIGRYITTLPPIHTEPIPDCVPPDSP